MAHSVLPPHPLTCVPTSQVKNIPLPPHPLRPLNARTTETDQTHAAAARRRRPPITNHTDSTEASSGATSSPFA
eukprot:scaffold22350_cov124-Isochrysis_galbana.AAC.2